MKSLDEHRRALFGLCYRMTGCAADAEDLVQETFRRALERPPADLEAPLRPWLNRVATNLCIDALRKRKSEAYFGPWLPSPVATEALQDDLAPTPEARYGVLESASMAFLIALETLSPRERAVVVLRDVLGLTGPEVGEALSMTDANVRVTLHRARQALEGYDADRFVPRPELHAQTKERLHTFLLALAFGDASALAKVLSDDVEAITDAAGETHALVTPVVGIEKVVRTFMSLREVTSPPVFLEERSYNGLPSVAMRLVDSGGAKPTRQVFQVALDADGRIAHVWSVIAGRKLRGIAFDRA